MDARIKSGHDDSSEALLMSAESAPSTASAATESSEGIEQVSVECEHCGHHEIFTRPIPRVHTTTSSSDTSSGSGG